MGMQQRAVELTNKLAGACEPFLQNEDGAPIQIALPLSGSEAGVLCAALAEFTAGSDDWQPIATLPRGRAWDFDDAEMGEDVSLARCVESHEPLFFILQEQVERKQGLVYEQTMWRPALSWPKPPRTASAAATAA